MRSRTPAALSAAFIFLASSGATLSTPALAQDQFVQRVNDLFAGPDRAVPESRRSDLALIPALIAMQPPPQGVATPLRAMLATPGAPAWDEAVAWATAPTQEAVIEQVVKVGEPGRGFAFLMPYGERNASPEARSAGVVVTLGEPPILATASFDYLDALTRVATLVHFEATRMAEDGRAIESADLLIAWQGLCRQIMDREFFDEKRWGARHAIIALERIRDIVHEYADQFTGSQLASLVTDLGEDNIAISRLQLPRADTIAGEQILARVFVERQGVSPEFGALMARVGAGDRPLRQFSESARWQALGDAHAGTFETGDALRAVFGNWDYRWRLPEFDRVRKQPTDFDRLDKTKFAVVATVAEGVQEMFSLRQRYRAEAEGTRLALAVMGFKADNRSFPASLSAVRPRYVRTVGADPYNEKGQEFHYFVPIRDQPRGARELPRPHEITFAVPENAQFTGTELFSGTGISGRTQGSLQEFKESIDTLPRAAEAMRASVEGMRAELEAMPASVRAEAEASLEVLAMGATLLERISTTEEVARIRALDDASAVSDAESQRLLSAAFARMEAIRDELAEGLSPAGKAAFEAGMTAARASLKFNLDDTDFVLYSAGQDQSRGWAREVGHGAADFLIWPPAISLYRSTAQNTGADLASIDADLLLISAEPLGRGAAPAPVTPPAQQTPPRRSPSGSTPF